MDQKQSVAIVIFILNLCYCNVAEVKDVDYNTRKLQLDYPTIKTLRHSREKRQTSEMEYKTNSSSSSSLDELFPLKTNNSSKLNSEIPESVTPISKKEDNSTTTTDNKNTVGTTEPSPPKNESVNTFSNSSLAQSEEIFDSVDKPENETNFEITKHKLRMEQDYHQYYNSTVFVDEDVANSFWESFKNMDLNLMLSRSHRRAMTVQLSFDFPFYGHPVRNVTVATGGFLYTGDYVHSWLAATQYIAPLMANFDTSLSNESFVRYSDNGTAFTVVWEKVSLQDKPEVGTFTFSTTLHSNGDIVFAYFSVPILIETIQDDKHPVKVGLSDAYIIDKVIFFARRKTIYEYHRVNFASQDIKNSTLIYLNAQPTCLASPDCLTCLSTSSNFKCYWCPMLNKCSTGTDRKRQEWLHKGCDRTQIIDKAACPSQEEKIYSSTELSTENINLNSSTNYKPRDFNIHNMDQNLTKNDMAARNYENNNSDPEGITHSNVGVIIGFMLPLCLVSLLLLWLFYAYRNPHTKSGQLLIQYRPSQWSWRRGEARYTAATIHM